MYIARGAKKLLISLLCLLLAFLLLAASLPVKAAAGTAAAETAENGREEVWRTKGQNLKGEPGGSPFSYTITIERL